MKYTVLTTTTLIAFIFTAIIINSCKEDLPAIPIGTNNKIELTLTTDSISYTFADLNYGINAIPNITEYQIGICFDTLTEPTFEDTKVTLGKLNNVQTISKINNLLPLTTYYARAYLKNGERVLYSQQLQWNTLDARPEVNTQKIDSVLAFSAKITCSAIAPEGFEITKRGVCWGETETPTLANSFTNDGIGNNQFTSRITGLVPDKGYFIRAYATNSEGTTYGQQMALTTQNGISTLTTTTVTAITAITATSGGTITSDGGATITARGVCWGTTQNPTTANSKTADGTGTGSFTSTLTGLTLNTTYYVRAYATNSVGTIYGNEFSFVAESIPTAGLVAYYPFNGNANDASGNSNNGSVSGATLTTDRKGNASSAYSFNGTSNYITTPLTTPLNLNDFSFSIWFYKSGCTNTYCFPISKGSNGDWNAIGVNCYSNLAFFSESISNFNQLDFGATSENVWINIILVRSNNTFKVFINGVKTNELTKQVNINNNYKWIIGTQNNGSSHYFNGKIDDIRIYNRALTVAEIQQLYNE